jgi:thioredoxin 1
MTGGIFVWWSLLGFGIFNKQQSMAPLTPDHWVKLDAENFKSAIAEGAILVNFWADWCKPCMELRATLEGPEIGITVGDYEFNFDDPIRTEYGIVTLPTAILFYNGEEILRGHADEKFQFTPEIKSALLNALHALADSLAIEE